MQAPLKVLIYAIVIIVVMAFGLGLVEWKKPDYVCWPESTKSLKWGEKVEVIHLGSLRGYVYPFSYTCEEQFRLPPEAEIREVGDGFLTR